MNQKQQVTRRTMLGATALAPVLAACGGEATQSAPGAVPTLRRTVTLTWLTDAGTPAHLEARTKQVEAFKQATGLSVDYQGTPDFATKVQAAFAGGTPPDLYFTRATTLTGDVSRKQAKPFDDFIKRDRFAVTDFYPTSLEQYRVGGKLHAFPFDDPNRSFFVNMTAFQEAGLKAPPTTYKDDSWTWDAFRTAMEGLQRRVGPQGGWAVDTGRDALRSWVVWVWNNGGDFLSKDGKQVVLNQPAGVEALAFLQDLIHRNRVAPPQAERGNVRMNFVQGKILVYEGGQPDVGANRREIGSSFTWDVVPLPKGKGPRTSAGGGSAYAMGSERQQEETWAFFKHIMSKPMQEIFMTATGAMVGLKSLVESPAFLQSPPAHMSLFVEGATVLRGDSTTVRWNDVQTVLNEQLNRLWLNQAQPKEVADTIKQQVDPLLT
ncbi:MAG TPA: sugar ABC transporter substrate-binding protein [Chloroflexota bacterium]|nr:sugar ABC transporter substrate-binding protein [Chloroflexota bacterium]